ncbi:MAG: helix-turn-helix domain-containing protein [Oscillospiraceae bacterium]|nr:helix-turn-helix domain-containing protein [Oscillospiraceae bacterium]
MTFDFTPFVRYIAKTSYFISNKYLIARDCRFLYVISGQGSFRTAEVTYELVPGTLIYYPYGKAYKIQSKKDSPLHFYTVNFDFNEDFTTLPLMVPEVERKHNKDEEIRSISETLQAEFSDVICIKDAIHAETSLRRIHSEALEKSPGYQQLQSAYLKILLVYVYRQNRKAQKNSLCEEIKELIARHPELNNIEVAQRLNYHPFYLNTVFKKSEGITLHKFIIQSRLTKAHELLTTTELAPGIISNLCGFSSQSHFSSCFKKEYNVSPGSIRKQT